MCVPIVIASGEARPVGVAAFHFMPDQTTVLWIDGIGQGVLRECELDKRLTCVARTAAATTSPHALVHDASTVFWLDNGMAGVGNVQSFDPTCATCTTPTTIVSVTTSALQGGLAVGDVLFWTDDNFGPGAHVYASPSQGTASPTTIIAGADSYTTAIAFDHGSNNMLYVDGGTIKSCPDTLAACTPTTVVSDQSTALANTPSALAIWKGRLYWTSPLDHGIGTCDPMACNATFTVFAQNQANPLAIAVDDSGVYWVNVNGDGDSKCDMNGGTVMMCPLAGCGASPVMLASGQACPYAIDTTDTAIVWANKGTDAGPNGSVVVLGKP